MEAAQGDEVADFIQWSRKTSPLEHCTQLLEWYPDCAQAWVNLGVEGGGPFKGSTTLKLNAM